MIQMAILLGIAFVLSTIGGGIACSTVLVMMNKAEKILSIGFGLSIVGGVIGVVFVCLFMLASFFGYITIDSWHFIFPLSIAAGAVTVIILMIINAITTWLTRIKHLKAGTFEADFYGHDRRLEEKPFDGNDRRRN